MWRATLVKARCVQVVKEAAAACVFLARQPREEEDKLPWARRGKGSGAREEVSRLSFALIFTVRVLLRTV